MTFEIVLYKGKTYAEGTFPVMLKFTNRGERKYRIVEKGFALHEKDWNKTARRPIKVIKSDNRYEKFTKIRNKLNELESKYTKEIDKLEDNGHRISIQGLIRRVENPIQHMTVLVYFERVIKQTTTNKQFGSSKMFMTCKQRIEEFVNSKEYNTNPDPSFHDINLRWLNDFRDFLRKKELKDTTIATYFRNLREVFNRAIGEEYCDERDYPFGRKKDNKKFALSQFNTETPKRSISQKDIQKIKNIDLSKITKIKRKDKYGKSIRALYRDDLENARTIFLFSYYAVGMNLPDIARLKWSDIKDGVINYSRQKTGKRMSTGVHPYNQVILSAQFLKTKDDKEDYVFDILHRAIQKTEKQIFDRIHRQRRLINESLKEIRKIAKIEKTLTMYVARHSSITHMIQNGTRLDVVQENAGHSDLKTTMIYNKQASQKEKSDAINGLH